MDTQKHKKYTGVPNEIILQNINNLAAVEAKIQIRLPIIPGHNDDIINLQATGQFIKTIGASVTMLQILPYHRLGLTKYERLGQKNLLEDLVPQSSERIEEIKTILEKYFQPVTIH